MITQAMLDHARRLQEATFVDRLRIVEVRLEAPPGAVAAIETEVALWEGPGRIVREHTGAHGSPSVVGGQPIRTQDWVAAIPWSAPEFDERHRLRVVTSRDPWLAGAVFRIDSPEGGTNLTARRFRCTRE